MGQNKLLLPVNGKPLIENVLDAVDAAGIQQQIVVLGTDLEQVAQLLRPKLGKVKIALNLAPDADMTSSFQTGLVVISNVEAAFLVLGDQPCIDPAFLKIMVQTMENNVDTLIVSPIHEGQRGHPLLFRRKLFAEILSLQPPLTIRDVVHAHVEGLVALEAPQWATFDVDTPKDYDELLQFMKTQQKL